MMIKGMEIVIVVITFSGKEKTEFNILFLNN